MVKVAYICDCCNREVSKESDLYIYELFSPNKKCENNIVPFEDVELCENCYNIMNESAMDIYIKLQKESKVRGVLNE